MKKPIIRPIREGDFAQLISLCEAHARYEGSDYNPDGKADRLEKYMLDPANGIQCMVLEFKDRLLGYCVYSQQFSTWDAGLYYYMDCLYLDESVRRMGFGKLFMNEVKKSAKSKNCDIQWQTPITNKNAIAFYKSLGAHAKTKERFFWTVRDDA